MDDIFVGRIMSTGLHTVRPDTQIGDAASEMIEHDIGSVVVVDDDNRLEGILTSTDFVRLSSDGRSSSDVDVAEYMTPDVVTTTANTPIRDVADTMIEHGFHHVPVVDETEGVIGIVTSTDLTAYLSHVKRPSPA
jgi:CBS domain-containing protein